MPVISAISCIFINLSALSYHISRRQAPLRRPGDALGPLPGVSGSGLSNPRSPFSHHAERIARPVPGGHPNGLRGGRRETWQIYCNKGTNNGFILRFFKLF
jgi:hypothetical protein